MITVNITAPSPVSADPGIMKWDTVTTPGSVWGQNTLLNWHGPDANMPAWPYDETGYGSEIIDMAVGNDGATVVSIVRMLIDPTTSAAPPSFDKILSTKS